jgi:hypothetical protein
MKTSLIEAKRSVNKISQEIAHIINLKIRGVTKPRGYTIGNIAPKINLKICDITKSYTKKEL